MAYTDLTSEFSTGDLVIWQHFDQLAENDAYKRIPSGTAWVFLQSAAPTGWTKVTSGIANQALRVVDGAGQGGSLGGGSYALGSTITLAHTHTTPGHTHTWTHDHSLQDESSLGGLSPDATTYGVSGDSTLYQDSGGANNTKYDYQDNFKDAVPTSGSTSPSTDSKLSDIVPKYYDALICTKN